MPVSLSLLAGAGWQFFDDNGTPLTGGKLYTYIAGTTTPATTYTDSTGTTANTNPVILNSAGRVPYEIWLTSGTNYKFILKTSTDVLIGTYDNIKSAATSLDGTGNNNAVAYFNATGAFTSSPNFTFNGATNALTVTGNISGNNLTAGGTLAVTGNSTFTGNATVTGTIASTGGITSATPAVTQASNDNSTKIATTAFVQSVAQNDKIQPLTASKDGSSNLNISLAPTTITFRSDTLSSGTTTLVSNSSTLTLQVPSGASLGATIGNTARLIVLAVYNGTTMQLAVTNSENGNQLDETNLITTTTTGATASAIYSGSTVSNKPYRIVGFIDIVLGAGSAWSNDPTTVQGSGGVAMIKVPALVAIQAQNATGASVDFTVPITAKRIMITFNGVSWGGATDFLIQIGYGTPETTGYTSNSASINATSPGSTGGIGNTTTGFVMDGGIDTDVFYGHMTLTTTGNNYWISSHTGRLSNTNACFGAGGKSIATGVTIVRITRVTGSNTMDAGTIGLMYE